MADAARTELIAGGVVLAVAAGFLLWSAGGSALPRGSYPVVASFPSIEGVEVGTDVRLAGVPIGRITEVYSSLREASQRAVVESFVDFSALDVVGVVVPSGTGSDRAVVEADGSLR